MLLSHLSVAGGEEQRKLGSCSVSHVSASSLLFAHAFRTFNLENVFAFIPPHPTPLHVGHSTSVTPTIPSCLYCLPPPDINSSFSEAGGVEAGGRLAFRRRKKRMKNGGGGGGGDP